VPEIAGESEMVGKKDLVLRKGSTGRAEKKSGGGPRKNGGEKDRIKNSPGTLRRKTPKPKGEKLGLIM